MQSQMQNEISKIIYHAPRTLTLSQVRKMLYDSATNIDVCTGCKQTFHKSALSALGDDNGSWLCDSCFEVQFTAGELASVS